MVGCTETYDDTTSSPLLGVGAMRGERKPNKVLKISFQVKRERVSATLVTP